MWSSASKPLAVQKNHEENRWTRPTFYLGKISSGNDSRFSLICSMQVQQHEFRRCRLRGFWWDGAFSAKISKRVLAFQLALEDKRKKSTSSFVGGDAAKVPKWAQKTVTLPAAKRGCHLVTPTILKDVEADLAHFQCGLAHFFLQHTSASLTINENYDSDVLDDVETWLTGTVPEGRKAPWKHTIEGPDDMPAHIKSSVFGCSLSIPITDGRLNLGTWQGIWLCEHRDHASARKVVITMTGV